MSAFPNDTFFAPGQSYYLKAGEPLVVPNPFQVEDNEGNFVTEIDTTDIGGGGIVGRSTLALKTTGGTLLSELLLTANTSSSLSALNVNVGQPGALSTLVVDGGLGVQTYAPITIFDTATPTAMVITSTELSSVGGSTIKLGNPTMVLNDNVTIDGSPKITATDPNTLGVSASLSADELVLTTPSASAKVGTTGTFAYFGFGTAPAVNPAISVDSNQSAIIQFTNGGLDKGILEMVGSNIVIGQVGFPNAISIDPAGVVDIPNLLLPATFTATTINATFVNVSSNLSSLDISANFIYAPTISASNVTAIGSVNTSALNSNSLFNLIEYQPTPTTSVNTTGSPGVWLGLLAIPISSNIAKCPSLDFHMPPLSISPNNPPNFAWIGSVGVIGDNYGTIPVNYKSYEGAINGRDALGGDTFILRGGVDYDAGTSNLVMYVNGGANNPEFGIIGGPSNVHIRGYPF